jgi:nucleotide-binding universal stress UspA family protein
MYFCCTKIFLETDVMFKHLLVPLDGSKLAEAVIPVVAYLAPILNASVMLIHVIESGAAKEIHGDRHLTNPKEAYTYLTEIARHQLPEGLAVQYHVHEEETKQVAPSIFQHSSEFHSDLVVLCTHGRRGVREFLFGSIAQQVIALGACPVLVLSPQRSPGAQEFSLSKILVPLDGNQQHEQCLPMAADLARACRAALHLVMVVPNYENLTDEPAAAGRLLPGTAFAMLDLAQQGGEQYLRECSKRISMGGIPLSGEVIRGEPIYQVIQAVERTRSDLIILGTHGKKATEAFWSGSLTPKIAARTTTPLLLVPVSDSKKG